jgi:predicted Zn-dependent peptidase
LFFSACGSTPHRTGTNASSVQQFTLSNGFTLIVKPTGVRPDRACSLGGGLHGQVDLGVAHVLEHMLFKKHQNLEARRVFRAGRGFGGRERLHQQGLHRLLPAIQPTSWRRDAVGGRPLCQQCVGDDEISQGLEVVKEASPSHGEQPQALIDEALNATVVASPADPL